MVTRALKQNKMPTTSLNLMKKCRLTDLFCLHVSHRVPRHLWGHGFAKVGDTDLKRRFQVSWCEIINYSIITIIYNI